MIEIDLTLSRASGFRLEVDTRLSGSGVTGIYGPSGSGKTSLLNCLAGLLPAAPGSRLTMGGQTLQEGEHILPPHQRDIACVFQDARLFPHLSVAGNLDFAWQRRRRDGADTAQVVEWLGLAPLLDRRPQQLSRGQQQRVAIARALVNAPRLLLLDEPLANIDRTGRRQLLSRLAQLQRELGIAMIYVSHDMAELAVLAEHLLLMSDGRIEAEGPLAALSSQIDLSLAHEEQAAALVRAEIRHHDDRYELTELSMAGHALYVTRLPDPPGTAVRLRLPARDISLCRNNRRKPAY